MSNKKSNNIIQREIYPEILKWLPEKEIIAINGPRRSGKTTLLKQLAGKINPEKTVYVDFEDTRKLESFLKSPTAFIEFQLIPSKLNQNNS